MLRTTDLHPLNHLLQAATQIFTTNQPISQSTPNSRVSKSSNPTSNQKQKTKKRACGLVWSHERRRDGRVVTSHGVLAHQRRPRFPRRWRQDQRRPWGGWNRWRRYPASETSRPWSGSVQPLSWMPWRSEEGDLVQQRFTWEGSEGWWCRRWSLRRRSLVVAKRQTRVPVPVRRFLGSREIDRGLALIFLSS